MRPPRILAVASGGGHWTQLLRLRPAWDDCLVTYVTTDGGYRAEVAADAESRGQAEPRFHTIVDANRWQKLRLIRQLVSLLLITLRARPDIVVSTGASPGFFALWIGKRFGARTIWIDSIANVEELSMSGEMAGRHADLWLTQWEHLAGQGEAKRQPDFAGSVV